jgi:hypothetical protein
MIPVVHPGSRIRNNDFICVKIIVLLAGFNSIPCAFPQLARKDLVRCKPAIFSTNRGSLQKINMFLGILDLGH